MRNYARAFRIQTTTKPAAATATTPATAAASLTQEPVDPASLYPVPLGFSCDGLRERGSFATRGPHIDPYQPQTRKWRWINCWHLHTNELESLLHLVDWTEVGARRDHIHQAVCLAHGRRKKVLATLWSFAVKRISHEPVSPVGRWARCLDNMVMRHNAGRGGIDIKERRYVGKALPKEAFSKTALDR